LRSPAAHILETAHALQRAPGERFRLRERPLPPGVIHLIEVAAGSPPALQAAAVELGEPEPVLLEAARFYLEQVLFADPDADAYRVLGLAPDVPHETVRTHHRWLQRWLHPDRAQAGDASVFATRVNQAFAQLRSPESRHAYDVRLAEARLASASAPLDPGTVRHWEHQEDAPRHGQRSRWLLAAALVSCVVLAVLIVRNPDKTAPWDPDADFHASADHKDPGPAIEDRDLGVLSAALAVAPEPKPAPAAAMPEEAAVPMPVPSSPAEASTRLPPPTPAVAPVPKLVAAAVRPAPRRADPAANVVSTVSTVPAASAPRKPAAAPAQIAGTPPLAASTATVAKAPPPAAPAPAPRVTVATAAEDPVVMFNRMRQAEQRVAQVAAFLAAKPGAAPMWNDPQTEAEAARLRTQLYARKGTKLELMRPSWRLQADSASLSADYRCRSAGSAPCEGRLDVKLVWREGLWLVRDVGLGPSA
jgi:hypothetical protein